MAKEVRAHPMGSRSPPDSAGGYNSPTCTRTCPHWADTQAGVGCAPLRGAGCSQGRPLPHSSSGSAARGLPTEQAVISFPLQMRFLPHPQRLISGAVIISTPLPTSPRRRLLRSLRSVPPAPTNRPLHLTRSPGSHCALTVLLQTVDQAGLLIN